jgi:hypothetical protein
MTKLDINYIAVFISAITSMVLGAIWYAKPVFGKMWMTLIGRSEEELKQSSMGKTYVIAFITSLLTAYVLAYLILLTASISTNAALILALWIWLGFVATTTLNDVLYAQKPFKLFLINNGYILVSLLVMAAILANWS